MATAASIFFLDVRTGIDWTLVIFAVVLQLSAFVHCLLQRADAFGAIGTLPKPGWLVILAIATVVTFVFNVGFLLFTAIGIAAAALYLLDVRPALKDATEGHGPW